jgi:hypothetical protein
MKNVAGIILGTPISVVISLALLELDNGDMRIGIYHLAQIVPLAIMLVVAWNAPRFGGKVILYIEFFLAILYLFTYPSIEFFSRLLNDVLLFGLPLIAGALFTYVGRPHRRHA